LEIQDVVSFEIRIVLVFHSKHTVPFAS
jgi:hypothetical protein